MSTANPSQPTAAALAAKAAMEGQAIEVFAAGTRPSMQGDLYTITRADLLKTAEAYDPALHEAPLTIGHPEGSSPAYGYALKFLVSSDNKLLMHAHQVVPEFALQAVDGGQLKKRSIEFYHPDDPTNPKPGVWYPRHVGALGAMPPAVKGLADIKPLKGNSNTTTARFSEAPTRRVSFAEDESTQAPAPRSTTMTPEEIAKLKADKDAAEKLAADALAAQKKAEAEAQAAKDAQEAARNAQAAARHATHVSFAEGLCGKDTKGARLLPADKDKVVAVLDTLAAAHVHKPVSFSEGGKDVAFDPVKFVQDALGALPVRVSFAEHKTQGTPVSSFSGSGDVGLDGPIDDAELHKRATAYMATHKVSYAEAADAVCKPVSFSA
ncbi:MAG: hypothetical protein RLZZ494_2119 [Pseudomonadota bacterium]|jgi:type II secretory pathway pseudopilin PulG